MKLRIGSACMLFLIALSVTVGALAAVPEESQAHYAVEVQTRGTQSLRLYDGSGALLEEITVDEQGAGSTAPLPEGTYYVVCREGLVQFSLSGDGELSLLCGGVTVDGTCLRYEEQNLTTLYITGKALGEWEDFLLIGEDYRRRQVMHCRAGQALECWFAGLLPGAYRLERNGSLVCQVLVEEGQVRQCVRLSAQ